MALAWLALSQPLAAQEEEPPSTTEAADTSSTSHPVAPRFLIESIAVEGTKRKAVERIVVGHSRLSSGREYGEPEIKDAVLRIKELPFVLDAHPSLRRGTAPGRYALVFEIKEDATFTFVWNTEVRYTRETYYDATWLEGQVGLGIDRFIGADSRIIATVGTPDYWTGSPSFASTPVFQLGYQKYNLFERGSRLTVSLGASPYNIVDDRVLWSQHLSAALLLPLGPRSSLTLGTFAERRECDFTYTWTPCDRRTATRGGAWTELTHATADDSFSPLRGTRLSGAVSIGDVFGRESRNSSLAFIADGAHAVPLSDHFTVEPRSHLECMSRAWSDMRVCVASADLALRYVHIGRRNRHRAFVEAGLTAGGLRRDADGFPVHDERSRPLRGFLALGLRSRAFLIRLSFSTEPQTAR